MRKLFDYILFSENFASSGGMGYGGTRFLPQRAKMIQAARLSFPVHIFLYFKREFVMFSHAEKENFSNPLYILLLLWYNYTKQAEIFSLYL